MRNFLLGLIPLFYPTLAIAVPVYITCPSTSSMGPIQFFLNESSDRATGQVSGYNPRYFKAMFNSSQVILTPDSGTGSRWTIDRTTLQATEQMYVGGPGRIWWSGECTKQSVPLIRAF